MTLEQWLTSHGLEKYIEIFRQNEIGIDILHQLTEADLAELGFSIGDRRRMLAAIHGEATGHQVHPPANSNPAIQPAIQVIEPAAPHIPTKSPGEFHPVAESHHQVKQPKGKSSRKATAILVAVAVHVAIILIATTLTIFAASTDEPEIIASIAPPSATPQQEMKKKTVQKQVKRAPSSASAAAAPMAIMMKANAKARFTTPEVTRTSTGPLGMGEGDLGAGAFGVGTGLGSGGGGGGATLFGSSGGGGLTGKFYDLKQTANREPVGGDATLTGYYDAIFSAEKRKFAPNCFSDFYKAPTQLSYTFLAVPTSSANAGPEAFQVADTVEPKGWLVHYQGRVRSPFSGRWRFVGFFDDILLVYVNKKLVLEASFIDKMKVEDCRVDFEGPAMIRGQKVRAGKWLREDGGFTIDILVGERPGGTMGGALMVQEADGNYKKRSDGSPIIPIFSTVALDRKARERLEEFPYKLADETPVFPPLTGMR